MTTARSPMMLLDRMYYSATSEADKGARFERFIQSFLQTDPTWAEQFSDVWLWDDWPGNTGHDIGVDLVARRRDEGLVAIQCKFYSPERHIAKGDIDSFLAASGRIGFTERIIVSTTTKWGPNAEEAISGQAIPVRRLGLADLEKSRINWADFDPETPAALSLTEQDDLRPYQRTAIDTVRAGFKEHDRGRMIMACGTGKTFTSLRLAEEEVREAGSVLFLVPSIALISQALREWSNQTRVGITAMAVCSDAKVSKARRRSEDSPEISVVDLALPATTNPHTLADRMKHAHTNGEGMRVVFATYQSIDVVAQAQTIAGLEPFDLIVCDEAHRTTGVTELAGDESAFIRVHDEDYLKASKRLYMTATPRIYDDASKAKAGKAQAVLASMDDEDTYGPEMYRLGFGDAVSMGMLTDYKVLILTVNRESVNEALQTAFADDGELTLDDATRLIGCWNGLAKRGDSEHTFASDPRPMRRAVAFTRSIKASQQVKAQFNEVIDTYTDTKNENAAENLLRVEVEHVDGTMSAMERNRHLDWLREQTEDNTSRVLSNARCLSEGVDVPSLDSVMFLNPRKSVVDVVQSVGRVMRLSAGKKYGYIILPVVVEAGTEPEDALNQNKNFQVVWEVLQALRAHDERFDAMVNKIDLNKDRDSKIDVIGIGFENNDASDSNTLDGGTQGKFGLRLSQMDDLRNAIYARMVQKVGSREYWDRWAKDIADIAQAHIERISKLVEDPTTDAAAQFGIFLEALRGNLNESITRDGAIEMLAQHMITKPVFDALFDDYEFTKSNPVSQVMDRMVATLAAMHVDAESAQLETFYESVRRKAMGIDNAAGKQKIITELYESFFKNAFPATSDSMGVVYTPVEIVDFILRSVNDILEEKFGRTLGDEGVHVLDPFTGTGTFIVRLLQSGLIKPEDLARKYASELHANEILLLAYYIAAINIETTYHDLAAEHDDKALGEEDYVPFDGIVLTDTFQLTEDGDIHDDVVFPTNNSRAERQKSLDIRVIVGNPPYSVGQTSANDDNANVSYRTLDARIRDTYARRTDATNKNSLYDSYMRAIRWASDRIGTEGIIGFVTNGGWIEGNTAAGVRKTLADEFSDIYVYNLRGNQRTAGEQSRKEGGKVFGSGSRNTVAVFLLVRNPNHTGTGTIHYHDIGDYLTAKDKLSLVDDATVHQIPWRTITPNKHGDWINQRDENYLTYPILGGQDGTTLRIFTEHSRGLETGRDAWVYNSSTAALDKNLSSFIDTYTNEQARFQEYVEANHLDSAKGPDTVGVVANDGTRIKWTSGIRDRLAKGRALELESDARMRSLYRPFFTQHVDTSDGLIHRPAIARRYFPSAAHENFGFYVTGVGSDKEFSVLATRMVPDLALWGSASGQFFPRYTWVPVKEGSLELGEDVVDGYLRVDNITDDILTHMRGLYGPRVTKDDVFYLVYGLLHSPDYRQRYAGELKQMLPRIPQVAARTFQALTDAGRELADLHMEFEDIDPYPLRIDGGEQFSLGDEESIYRVEKMRFPSGRKAADCPSRIIMNPNISVEGIPEEAYRFQLGSRSAIEWVMRQYQVTTDKASGIGNDPNQWGAEQGDPRYIIDLLEKVVAVSVRSTEIMEKLPKLD